MRRLWAVIPLFVLSACGSEIAAPPSGVGFGDYDQYLAERARQQSSPQGLNPGMVVSPESTASADITIPEAPLRTASAANVQPAPTTAQPGPVVDTLAQETAAALARTADPNNPTISDEQNFEAVAARETIESDRERLERQRAQFEVIAPTELPRRRGGEAPNIVAYALSTTNSIGEVRFSRGPFNNANASQKACRGFLSDDLAQEAFLAAGGPQRDPKRLDPDGDGFACGWDPAPYRLVRR